jgi:hypothetical protein
VKARNRVAAALPGATAAWRMTMRADLVEFHNGNVNLSKCLRPARMQVWRFPVSSRQADLPMY